MMENREGNADQSRGVATRIHNYYFQIIILVYELCLQYLEKNDQGTLDVI